MVSMIIPEPIAGAVLLAIMWGACSYMFWIGE